MPWSHGLPPPPATTPRLHRWLARHTATATFTLAAEHLGLSERTLSRRLAQEGTSFRALLDITRHRKALSLAGEMPPEDLARVLGYSGSRPFLRAFKRWTGVRYATWSAHQVGPDSSRQALDSVDVLDTHLASAKES